MLFDSRECAGDGLALGTGSLVVIAAKGSAHRHSLGNTHQVAPDAPDDGCGQSQENAAVDHPLQDRERAGRGRRVRFALGEGIEREESDFAAEVAAAVKD